LLFYKKNVGIVNKLLMVDEWKENEMPDKAQRKLNSL